MRIALKFGYNGINFHGLARQPNIKTIEGAIINSLLQKELIKDIKNSDIRFASRTDKGVSALGNVIAFNTEQSNKDILNILNNKSDNILFYGIKKVNDNFNPRHAKHRIYSYYLINQDLDIDSVITACSIFIGTHNFSNFARIEIGKNPVRTIDNIILRQKKDVLVIDFYAENFLWNQIRRVISAIEKFNTGKITKKQIITALKNPTIFYDFGLASAKPLILKDIIYDFKFKINKDAYKKLIKIIRNL